MTFTRDSRWLAVSTKRGTTHLFAINPYGGEKSILDDGYMKEYLTFFPGATNVRTHKTAYVVNKANRYHHNPLFDEQPLRSLATVNNDKGIKDTPSTNSSNVPSNLLNNANNNSFNLTRMKRSNNECIFSTAVTLIRQPTDSFVSGLSAPFNTDSICLASAFGISRGFLNPEDMINHQDQSLKACSSLFIISWHGRLIEYILEPIAGKHQHSSHSFSYLKTFF